MVDRTQQLIWTALPNGSTTDHKHLRLSVLVTPRLTTTADPGEALAMFPDFLDWADRAGSARYAVLFDGKDIEATVEQSPDINIQRHLFDASTFVRAYQFEDRRDTSILTSPVVALAKDLAEIYGSMAANCDDELPSRLDWLPILEGVAGRQGPRDGDRGTALAEVIRILRARRHERILEDRSPLNGNRAGRFALADAYNTPLSVPRLESRLKTGPEDPREDVAWQTHELVPLAQPGEFQRTMDFHRIISLLSLHPRLLLASGFRIDLILPRDAFQSHIEDKLSLRVEWSATNSVQTLPDVLPATQTILLDEAFTPAPRFLGDPTVSEGFIRLRDAGLAEVDVNGSALKVRQFAVNIANTDQTDLEIGNQPMAGRDPVATEPDRAGAPSLRSGGFVLASDSRGFALEDAFDRAVELQGHLSNKAPVILFQEDLLRGVRVEIADDSGLWRSLCRRDSRYRFLADQTTFQIDDQEGTVRLAAQGAADGTEADLLKVDAALFSWDGWSLTAPRPGRAIAIDDTVRDPESLAPPGLPLEVDHIVVSRSLPSLRFGRNYKTRLRAVDLAGNARAFDANAASPAGTETVSVTYRRFEPIEAPGFALVGGVDLAPPTLGESLHIAAIRSLNETEADNLIPSVEISERHIIPPSASQRMAELHGMLDVAGRLDPASYNMLVARDGELGALVADASEDRFPVAEPIFTLPYLPDPMSRTCRLRVAGFEDGTEDILDVPFYADGAAWPDANAFRIMLGEGPRGASFDSDQRILFVPLEKADHVRVRISHSLERKDLGLLGVYNWGLDWGATNATPDQQRAMEERALAGRHWMLTPWRDIELVHAVQKPLVRPEIQALTISRPLGGTAAAIGFETPVDSRSTEKLDLSGHWLDPVDDVDEPAPVWHVGGGHATELKLDRLEAPGIAPPGHRIFSQREVGHIFPDTRYRRVGYTLAGTTRFTQFMPEALRDPTRAADLSVVSDEAIGFVPNSAPPPAPDIVYVIPTFGWTRATVGDEQRSFRDGGGLRVYLRRPWLVSGAMEMLGVVLPPAGMASTDVDAKLGGFVTRWGGDAALSGSGLREGSPARGQFPESITTGPIAPDRLDPLFPKSEGALPANPFPVTQLPMPGTPAGTRVEIAPHLVGFDDERQLWFADIVLDAGLSYSPFIRLALARYQPISAPGAHLSAPAMAEVLQLTNDRLATVARRAPLTYRVSLFGIPFTGVSDKSGPARPLAGSQIELLVEWLDFGTDEDFGWLPLDAQITEVPPSSQKPRPVTRKLAASAETLREQRKFGQLTKSSRLLSGLLMPEIGTYDVVLSRTVNPGERFRLAVLEREPRPSDSVEAIGEGGRVESRIVYLETFALEI